MTEDVPASVGEIDLSVPSLVELHKRRSEKWASFDDDVMSATIAEMDFPLAAPIRETLHAAVDRHDLGYALPAPASLCGAFAGFAARRLDWTVDPEQVTVVPDVMLGLLELCRTVASAGESIGFAVPAYPPFLREVRLAGLRIAPLVLTPEGALDLDSLDEALAQGLRAIILSNPHNPTGRALPRSELGDIR